MTQKQPRTFFAHDLYWNFNFNWLVCFLNQSLIKHGTIRRKWFRFFSMIIQFLIQTHIMAFRKYFLLLHFLMRCKYWWLNTCSILVCTLLADSACWCLYILAFLHIVFICNIFIVVLFCSLCSAKRFCRINATQLLPLEGDILYLEARQIIIPLCRNNAQTRFVCYIYCYLIYNHINVIINHLISVVSCHLMQFG